MTKNFHNHRLASPRLTVPCTETEIVGIAWRFAIIIAITCLQNHLIVLNKSEEETFEQFHLTSAYYVELKASYVVVSEL